MFLGPFLLGGVTGLAVAPWFYGVSPYYYPYRPFFRPYRRFYW